ncbi:Ankyrin repeat and KH domain-containing protein mask [Gryllus bimaculatus]|nr:Ankyrin repeat and KH domain-containing protein mask [Gryllus bimaculatus]
MTVLIWRAVYPTALAMALGIRLVLTSPLIQISEGVNVSPAIFREQTTDTEERVDIQNRTFTKASAEIQGNIHLTNCESLHPQKVLEIVLCSTWKLCDNPIENNIANDYSIPLVEKKQATTAPNENLLQCPVQSRTNNEIANYLQKGSLLHFLAEANATDALQSLVLLGADISKQDHQGDTPLHYAVRSGAYGTIRLLLKAGSDPKTKGANDLTPLDAAAERGDTEAVRILIHEATNETADVFMHVIRSQNYDALKTLINAVGVLPKRVLDIALVEAIKKEDREATRLLIAAKSDNVSSKEEAEAYPLSEATSRGREDILKDLLDAWGYVDERNEKNRGRTPLMAAAYNNNPRSIRMLVEAGAPLEDVDSGQQTALFYAGYVSGTDALSTLVELGANVNATDDNGENILHKSVHRNPAAVEILLKAGIDKEARNNQGRTPVFKEAGLSSDALHLLLKANVSLNIRDNENLTPFLFHALNGDEYGTALLLEWAPDLEERDENGNTALLLAAKQASYARHNYPTYNYTGLLNTVRILVEAGADVDTQNFEGLSPLLWFVDTGFASGVEFLLGAGADKDIRDLRGYALPCTLRWKGGSSPTRFCNSGRTSTRGINKGAPRWWWPRRAAERTCYVV